MVHKPDRRCGLAHPEHGRQVPDRFKSDGAALCARNEHAGRQQKIAGEAIGASLGVAGGPLGIDLAVETAKSTLPAVLHPVA